MMPGRGHAFPPEACVMLVLCSTGAVGGLLLDVAELPPGGLCLAAGSLGRHWAVMPWMNGGMLAGGLLAMLCLAAGERCSGAPWRHAVLGRAGFNLACHAAMLASMTAGPLLAAAWGLPGSAFGQAGGMLAAMLAAVALVALSYSFAPQRRRGT
jgi:hypothetical protein